MAIQVDSLVKGKEYKVKYEGDSRAATRTFDGEHQCYEENAQGEVVKGEVVARFSGRGGTVFFPYEGIISAVEVDPAKKKARKPRMCPRCFGNKRFEHLSHVLNGTCFQCGGTGTV